MLNPICLHQVKHGIKKIKGVLKFADGDMIVMYTTLLQVIGIPLLFFFFFDVCRWRRGKHSGIWWMGWLKRHKEVWPSIERSLVGAWQGCCLFFIQVVCDLRDPREISWSFSHLFLSKWVLRYRSPSNQVQVGIGLIITSKRNDRC